MYVHKYIVRSWNSIIDKPAQTISMKITFICQKWKSSLFS